MDTPIKTSQLPAVPVMSRSKFADLVGVSINTVTGWINRGYLPVVRMGKYRLVNLALLHKLAYENAYPSTDAFKPRAASQHEGAESPDAPEQGHEDFD